jgi:hypothetical protein
MVKIRDIAASSSLACSSLVRSFAFSPSLETALVFLGYSSSPSSASLFHLQNPKASNKQSTEVKTRGEKTRKTTKLITQQREEALQRQKQKTALAGNPRETMIACKDNTRKPRKTRQRLAREREIETETQRDGDGERERREKEREKRNNTQVERKPGQACVAGSNGPHLSVSQLERSRSPKDPLKTDPDLRFYLHTLSNPPWCVPTLRAYWPIGKFQSSSWTISVPTDPSFSGVRGGGAGR